MKIDPGSAVWKELRAEINAGIDINEYYKRNIPSFKEINLACECPFCGFDKPNMESFFVFGTGGYRCHERDCQSDGESIIDFFAQRKGIEDRFQAARALYSSEIESILDERFIQGLRGRLQTDSEKMEVLRRELGIQKDVVENFSIGYHEESGCLSFPVCNHLSFYVSLALVNAFGVADQPPVSYLKQHMSKAHIWPLNAVPDHKALVFASNHLEAACAISCGVMAICLESPARRPLYKELELLRGKDIYICYDMSTDEGKVGAHEVATMLVRKDITDRIKIVTLPSTLRKYLSVERKEAADLFDFARGFDWFTYTPTICTRSNERLLDLSEGQDLPFINVEQSAGDEWYEKMFRTEGTVISMGSDTVKVPRRVQVRCNNFNAKCGVCPIGSNVLGEVEEPFEMTDPDLSRMIDMSATEFKTHMKRRMGLNMRCPIDVHVSATYTATPILISPPIKHYRSDEDAYAQSIQVGGYFFSTTVQANGTYLFTGYTSRNGKNKTILMLVGGEPVSTGLDTFQVTSSVREGLAVFQPPRDQDLFDHLLNSFYGEIARTVTKIRGRELTHMAMDLVWHSPNSFYFGGQWVRKGSLDAIVFGDTGCGKSEIARNLLHHYEFGDMLSGENISMMNMIGGIRNTSNYQGICWGVVAQMNRGMLVIDELSNLTVAEINRLSTLRNDGIAQVEKMGYRGRANALTSILWLSNSRDGRHVKDYDYGVRILDKLVEKKEDIRRFDYGHCVCKDDVPNQLINQMEPDKVPDCRYSSQDCHHLILWVKSRRPNQIYFTDAATQRIFVQAESLSEYYHSDIPLVLASTMKIKLARLAAAVAGRIFNADVDTGEILRIDEDCVDCAAKFLDAIYHDPAMGYDVFSKARYALETIDEERLEKLFKLMNHFCEVPTPTLVSLFLKSATMTRSTLSDWVGGDREHAAKFMSGLLHLHAIEETDKYSSYRKTKPFVRWLRNRSDPAGSGDVPSKEEDPFTL